MRNLKRFWPLYLLYSGEALMYVWVCFVAYVQVFGADAFPFLDADLRSEIAELGAWSHLLLAAPVIFGFFFRLYFIKGLWIAYAWFPAILGGSAGELWQGEWMAWSGSIIHPVIVTAVLLLTRASRTYFMVRKPGSERPEDEGVGLEEVSTSEAFLHHRLKKSREAVPTQSDYRYGLLQGIWIGIALFIWGLVLAYPLAAGFGFCLLLACFLFHRRSRGRNQIFFRKQRSEVK